MFKSVRLFMKKTKLFFLKNIFTLFLFSHPFVNSSISNQSLNVIAVNDLAILNFQSGFYKVSRESRTSCVLVCEATPSIKYFSDHTGLFYHVGNK